MPLYLDILYPPYIRDREEVVLKFLIMKMCEIASIRKILLLLVNILFVEKYPYLACKQCHKDHP